MACSSVSTRSGRTPTSVFSDVVISRRMASSLTRRMYRSTSVRFASRAAASRWFPPASTYVPFGSGNATSAGNAAPSSMASAYSSTTSAISDTPRRA